MAEINEPDGPAFQRARTDALRLLRFRPRSVKEMIQRLKQKCHRGSIIARVIGELEEKKLLDDRAFAKLWIGDRISLKPSGKSLVARELKSKGIADAVIEGAFEEFRGAYDEYGIARPLALKKAERLKGIDKEKAMKRLMDFLSRRGFSYDTIRRILKEIYKDRGIEE
jgi:regulatory protein